MSEKCGRLVGFGFVCFLAMWSLLAMLVLANPIADRHSFSFQTDIGTSVSDFVHFYQAGAMCISDERAKIYDPATQLEFTNRLIKPDHVDNVFYIQYVPFIFPMMTPLAMLPMATAYALWYALSLVFGMAGIFLIIHDVQRFSVQDRLILMFGILSSAPSLVALRIGQISWFLLCFASLVYFAVKHRRDVLGGVSLALLTVKPQYVPLFLVSMLSIRRWKLLMASFIAEALLLALGGFTVGWKNIYNYPAILLHAETTSTYSGVFPESMVSIRGALSTFLPQWAALAVSLTVMVLSALLAYTLWQSAAKKRISVEWAMALTMVLCLVVSPHCHGYDLLLLSLPAILTLPSVSLVKIVVVPSIWLRVWSLILVSYPITSWIAYGSRLHWLFLLLNFVLLVSGLLHVYFARSSPEPL